MDTDTPVRPVGVLERDLSEDERARASRLRSPLARHRFIQRRHALRHILARYLGAAPERIAFTAGPLGKPLVTDREVSLHFSISQSDGIALVALATVPVGVDVEHVHAPRRLERTARRMLHEQTAALILSLPPAERTRAFYDAWTQREAHVKAIGGGLFHTPDTLPFAPGASGDGSVHLLTDIVSGEAWSVVRFTPEPQSRAAVVANGRISTLTFTDWEGPR